MQMLIFKGTLFGIVTSVPLILSSRKVSYADQAIFSFAFWPSMFKILFAPLIDSIYLKNVGRRKSWIISTMTMIGILMFSISFYVDQILDSKRVKQEKGI